MDKLFGTVWSLGKVKFRWDDDFSDRLSRVYSGGLMVIFAFVISAKQYVGDPIVCWTPGTWPSSHQKYAENVCWIINTYYVPAQEGIPRKIEERGEKEIGYYQWVPFMLLLQSLLFYIPAMVWRSGGTSSGVNLKNIIDAAVDLTNLNPENRTKTVLYLTRHVESALTPKRIIKGSLKERCSHFFATRLCCLFWDRRYGNYLTILYLMTKVLYIINAAGQLFLLNYFLGTDNYTLYGVQFIVDLQKGHDWTHTARFPRITLCDFVTRVLGNDHRHTVQCVLPINLFNEKIYLFQWFWLATVSLITIVSLFSWTWFLQFEQSSLYYIEKFLESDANVYSTKSDRALLRKFLRTVLRQDGLLIIRLIEKNAGVLIAAEITTNLWLNFFKKILGSSKVTGNTINTTQKQQKRTAPLMKYPKRINSNYLIQPQSSPIDNSIETLNYDAVITTNNQPEFKTFKQNDKTCL